MGCMDRGNELTSDQLDRGRALAELASDPKFDYVGTFWDTHEMRKKEEARQAATPIIARLADRLIREDIIDEAKLNELLARGGDDE